MKEIIFKFNEEEKIIDYLKCEDKNLKNKIKKFILDINEVEDYENGNSIFNLIKKQPYNDCLYKSLIYLKKDIPVGIINIVPDDGKNFIAEKANDKPPFIWIAGFVINRKYRNKRYGKKFFAKTLEYIKNNYTCKEIKSNFVYLFVEKQETRKPAMKIYTKLGFKIFHEDEKYYYLRYRLEDKIK